MSSYDMFLFFLLFASFLLGVFLLFSEKGDD